MPTRPPVHRDPAAPLTTAGTPLSNTERHRLPPRQRGYDWTWEKLRLAFLARHPLCLFHEQKGEIVAASNVDHIEDIAERPDLRLTWSNLRSLCHACHSARTARDRVARSGGTGTPPR